MDLAIVGLGKIAQDQHLPAVGDSAAFSLAAIVDQRTVDTRVPVFGSVEALVGSGFCGAVAICTPPAARFDIARVAIEAGLHTFLEKPPCLSTSEVDQLADLARRKAVTLFAAWHSREAAMVAPAKAYLADRQVQDVTISWREDIRRWHPGQDWILDEGGFGVFDPGINAFSILTEIIPGTHRVESCLLEIPDGRASPIAAQLAMQLANGGRAAADLDFTETGEQTWEIRVRTDAEEVVLADGGSRLMIGDKSVPPLPGPGEYRRLYDRFAHLIDSGQSDADSAPLALVADAFRVARRKSVAPFEF
ncbi:Gfo/Idh/MocA family oxidoreductase [Citromicrobium bathyomarinum]|uniref:Gfo/Idh/MocA family protein n=1 Tax=Citromicrobium bathyomarinum TaxID=72174 RepID=UPI00315A9C17